MNAPPPPEPAPSNGGIAGRVWFLPYIESGARDTPEVAAARELMRRDGYPKGPWEPRPPDRPAT